MHCTNCLSAYLHHFKTIYDELIAIAKHVPVHKNSWWLLNGLCKDFEIFIATMLHPLVPSYVEIVTLLESYVE